MFTDKTLFKSQDLYLIQLQRHLILNYSDRVLTCYLISAVQSYQVFFCLYSVYKNIVSRRFGLTPTTNSGRDHAHMGSPPASGWLAKGEEKEGGQIEERIVINRSDSVVFLYMLS